MRSAASEPRRARPPPAPVRGDWRRGRGSEGRGTNQRRTKPELKAGLSSPLQMGQQLRCRRAAGIIGAGGQQLSGGSPVPPRGGERPVPAQGITLFRFIAGPSVLSQVPQNDQLEQTALRSADLGESPPHYSLFLFPLLQARGSKELRDDEKRKFSPAFLSCL